MKPKLLSLALLLLLILVAGIATTHFLGTPAPRTAEAPSDLFSAGRAAAHLEVIARRPHPTGTAENARVRDYLVGVIESLGLTAEIQTATVFRPGLPIGGRIANVLTRLEGREDGPALLLMSHYDSAPTSPGAGDDGSGTAAMLEALRALAASEPLRRDIIFLFTDGEEGGLLGARAFAAEHPMAEDVGAVVNFEARGSRGPSLMFETGPGNAAFIDALRHVDPRATSYSYEIYQRMPNDTDFTVFKRRGVPGLNFAFIHDLAAYHSAQDHLERLDRGSLQAHGEAALGLARRLTQLDLGSADLERGGDAVYFNLPGYFVSYRGGLTLPLAILAGLGTLAALIFGLRRRRFTAGSLTLAFFVLVLGALFSGALCFLLSRLLAPRAFGFLIGGTSSNDLLLLAFALFAAGCSFFLVGVFRSRGSDILLGAGMLLFWLLGLGLALVAPGASYLFVWPVIFALPVAWLRLRGPAEEGSQKNEWKTLELVLLSLPAAAAALLWAPSLEVIGAALGPVAVVLLGLMTVWILVSFQAPVLAHLLPQKRVFMVPLILVLVGILGILAVSSAVGFDEQNRRQNSILYFLDTESGEARWWSLEPRVDSWTAQFLTESPAKGPRPLQLWPFRGGDLLNAAAPALDLAAPTAELLGVRQTEEGRIFDVRLAADHGLAPSGFDVERLSLFIRPLEAVRELRVAGVGVARQTDPGRPSLIFLGPPDGGLELEITTPSDTESLELDFTVQRHALPAIPGFEPTPRPADTMPRRFTWLGESTYVRAAPTLLAADAAAAAEEIPTARPSSTSDPSSMTNPSSTGE